MLLYGIAAVTVLWFFLSNFAHANPATLAKLLKVIGGVLAFGIAGLLAVRGRIGMALLIGSFGAWLLGWRRLTLPNLGARAQRASGRTSRVRSQLIEMTLDHDTGEMEGSVLAGTSAGLGAGKVDRDRILADSADHLQHFSVFRVIMIALQCLQVGEEGAEGEVI